jgi:hypothetical protein
VDSVPAPATVPGAPTGVTAVNGSAALSVNVTWVAPANNGGAPITGYKANAVSDTSKTCTAVPPALTCTITGLPVASYTFVVKAINGVGSSAASAPSNSVTTGIAHGFKSGAAFAVESMGKGLVFRIPETGASRVRVSVMDMHGRNVWNRTVLAGAGRVAWNGVAGNGQGIGSGLYLVRMDLLDAQGKAFQSLHRKVPLAR